MLTTQYLDEAERLADEITVIDHGRVIARGTSEVLKSQVGGDRLEVQLADVGQAARAREALASRACGPILVGEDRRSLLVPVVRVEGLVPIVVRQLDEAGIGLTDIAARQATLDDVFFALTGHSAEEADEPEPEKVHQ